MFILCTTEAQQIPATIVSRCQNFQFRAVEIEKVVERMRWICQQEGIQADDDALISMALAGDGSIRDSLSTLDQAIACFGNQLETGPVRDLLGAIPSEITDELVQALRNNDAAAMLALVDRVTAEGRHVQHFCGELTRYFRNLLVLKVAGEDTRLVTLGPNERGRVSSHVKHFSQEDLTRYLHLLLELYRELQHAAQPRFLLEVGLLKLVYAGHLQPLEKVLAEWGGGSKSETPPAGSAKGPAGGAKRAAGAAASPENWPAERLPAELGQAEPKTLPTQTPSPVASATTAPAASAHGENGKAGSGDLRQQLIRILIQAGDHHLADAIEHGLVEQLGGQIEVRTLADYRTSLEFDLETLTRALRGIASRDVRVILGGNLTEADLAGNPAASGGSPAARAAVTESREGKSGLTAAAPGEVAGRALADPEVQKYQKLFGGHVREVRDLRGYSS